MQDGKGVNPVHQSDLTAKKGYFMFDKEVVCLGTNIHARNNNNAEVLTIVDSGTTFFTRFMIRTQHWEF